MRIYNDERSYKRIVSAYKNGHASNHKELMINTMQKVLHPFTAMVQPSCSILRKRELLHKHFNKKSCCGFIHFQLVAEKHEVVRIIHNRKGLKGGIQLAEPLHQVG